MHQADQFFLVHRTYGCSEHTRVQVPQPTTPFIGLTASGWATPGTKTSAAKKFMKAAQPVHKSGLIVGNLRIYPPGMPG